MTTYHLAIDIGASSGRHILGWVEDGTIHLHETHRFTNGAAKKNGRLCWDVDHFERELVAGMKKCAAAGKIPSTIAIDTWGVDFVLLDADDARLGDAVSYRDDRTRGIDEKVFERIGEAELYRRTGIQRLPFNTIYQIYSLRLAHPELLAKAKTLLLMPEYLNFFLTGAKLGEYTNATTTNLVNAESKDWDRELLRLLDLPETIFQPIAAPGASAGRLRPSIRDAVGFDAEVLLAPSHDTASAVASVPFLNDDAIFLSSGTWSLMGIERLSPDCGESSRKHNFTNEGGIEHRFRYLKNIMGLWMIQSIKKELPGEPSFDDLVAMARSADDFSSHVNVNDDLFLAPASMTEAIREYCRIHGLAVPRTDGEILACAYHSLADCYARTVSEIGAVTGRRHDVIHIVGGGSKDDYLNTLTARYTGRAVYAGPVEATSLGNIISQMLSRGTFPSLQAAREAVRASFPIRKVEG